MAIINVDELQIGMVLAEDIKSPQGRMLLPKGTELSHKHLNIFKIWGVTEADIEGVDAESVESKAMNELDPELLLHCKRLLAPRFAHVDTQNPVMRELARLAVLRLAKRLTPVFAVDPQVCANYPQDKASARSEGGKALPPLDLHKLLTAEARLASLPDIFIRIVEVINSPRSSASHIAEVISNDVSLSAKLLRLVNSPFYGFPNKIDTLSRAVTIVGSNHLTNLALGISVITLFKDIPPELLDMKQFWRHSVYCGILARLLAGHMRMQNEERFFVAGLLHDLGRLLLLKNAPEHYCAVLSQTGAQSGPAWAVERKVLGFDHAKVGSRLLETWNFPTELRLAVAGHHTPALGNMTPETCVVHVANVTAHALQTDLGGALDLAPPFHEQAWESLGLKKSVFAITASQADHQLSETLHIFFSRQAAATPSDLP